MNLRKQLLLVSLLTLILPWAGCQFIRETESALREGQQQMLAGTAQAISDSLSQFPDEFLASRDERVATQYQLYGHPLSGAPLIDGYFDEWTTPDDAAISLRGADGAIRFKNDGARRCRALVDGQDILSGRHAHGLPMRSF